MYNCPEIREKLTEIKTLKEELVSGLDRAQDHQDTLVLVNLQEKIEEKMKSLEEMFPINIERLEEKHGEGESLSKKELYFIYKLDKLFNKEIEVRGKDIEEKREQIEEEREPTRRQDLAQALDCREEQISLTRKEALKGDIKYHHGYLDLRDLTSAKDLKLPESIGGHLNLWSLTSAKDLKLPELIGGGLDLRNLISTKDLELTCEIKGKIYLENFPQEEKEELKRKYPHLVSKI